MNAYMGKICRVNLTTGEVTNEFPEESVLRRFIGGEGLGAYYVYKEVEADTEWDEPGNIITFMSGPLGGSPGPTGTICVVSKGALTGELVGSQANGKMGAFLRFCGYDGLIIQGKSDKPVYLHITEELVELKDASDLMGLDTWKTEEEIEKEIGKSEDEMSVMSIGPAGENLVRISSMCADRGHMVAHNGAGAVMGAKNLKAVAVERGTQEPPYADLSNLHQKIYEVLQEKSIPAGADFVRFGTARAIVGNDNAGILPVKNYTESDGSPYYIHDGSRYDRTGIFKKEHMPCWGCMFRHCHKITVTKGKLKGMVGEEQEYEGSAELGPNLCMKDAEEAQMLGNLVDFLGMDVNAIGYILSWLMECYEKGIATKADLDGIEMEWGSYEACTAVIRKIAYRDGIGDILADGLHVAAEKLFGGEGRDCGVYVKKGVVPRGHDHRQTFNHLLDTCTSSIGTDEVAQLFPNNVAIGLPADTDKTTPEGCAKIVAACYRDSMKMFTDTFPGCYCGFIASNSDDMLKILRAAVEPDWEISRDEIHKTGLRIATLMRAFCIRNAKIKKEEEWPSARYGSAVLKGPLEGKSILDIYPELLTCFYREMGWDEETGAPLPETLRELDLDFVIKDLWPEAV